MQRNVTISTVAAISFALAACGSADRNESSSSDNVAATNEMASDQNNTMAGNDTAMTSAPQNATDFAAAAGASDMFEIQSSKMAQSQASSAKVKDFASMLVTDHTKSTT